jgi:predicted Fe-Mo cluster-binding NifX family protein
MKLAVCTADKKTIFKDRFEESPGYLIFEILNGKITSEELRKNDYSGFNKLQNHEQIDQILDLLKDCTLFLGKTMRKESLEKIGSQNIDIIITDMENIDEAVSSYLESKLEYFQYYDLKTGKCISCTNRLLYSQNY